MKGNETGTEMTRAEALRMRAYRVLGHGGITKMAGDIGEHRSWVSSVLNGKETSAPVLGKVESYLDEIEAARAGAEV